MLARAQEATEELLKAAGLGPEALAEVSSAILQAARASYEPGGRQPSDLSEATQAEVEQTLEWARAHAASIIARAQEVAEELLTASGLGPESLAEVSAAIVQATRSTVEPTGQAEPSPDSPAPEAPTSAAPSSPRRLLRRRSRPRRIPPRSPCWARSPSSGCCPDGSPSACRRRGRGASIRAWRFSADRFPLRRLGGRARGGRRGDGRRGPLRVADRRDRARCLGDRGRDKSVALGSVAGRAEGRDSGGAARAGGTALRLRSSSARRSSRRWRSRLSSTLRSGSGFRWQRRRTRARSADARADGERCAGAPSKRERRAGARSRSARRAGMSGRSRPWRGIRRRTTTSSDS